jgi:hypothetical protein
MDILPVGGDDRERMSGLGQSLREEKFLEGVNRSQEINEIW